jgi:UDP-galactopyranose mutase
MKNLKIANEAMQEICEMTDLIVFSHLRWDFVFQRPQHLMSRFAKHRRVYFFEEPIFGTLSASQIHIKECKNTGVRVVQPHLVKDLEPLEQEAVLMELVDELLIDEEIRNYNFWYYTPMAIPFSRHLNPNKIMYDCMDELSHFKGAPKNLLAFEAELMQNADLVFTGGQSLYEYKKDLHYNIHPFPSSIDYKHFAQARMKVDEPADQKNIPHPRMGFFGVIDERMNIELLGEMATKRPEWQFVIIGPIAKIDPETLPKNPNIHYLGQKSYDELPSYLSGWDCAIMPFALNDSTKFISPTKTPEFLAAGRPVVSTSIRDVVQPYGAEKLVYIADTSDDFLRSIELAMAEKKNDPTWLQRVDKFLSDKSWDRTWARMAQLEIQAGIQEPAFQTPWQEVSDKPVVELV